MDPVMNAIEHGQTAMLVVGNIKDLVIAGDRMVFRPAYLAEQLSQKQFVVIQYCRSTGLFIPGYPSLPPKIAGEVDSRLRVVGLEVLAKQERQTAIAEEITQVFRGLTRLLMLPAGEYLKFAVIIDYTEHLTAHHSSSASEDELFAAESLHSLGISPALKKSGNALICLAREGFYNPLLNDLHRVEYSFPSEQETRGFAELILKRNNNGRPFYAPLAGDLTPADFGRLTRGVKIRDLESAFRENGVDKIALERRHILTLKAKSVLSASEGTLSIVQPDITPDDIVGLETPKYVINEFAKKLRAGDPASPRGLLFVGPPGTAKSTFAGLLGQIAGFNVLQFEVIKNAYVGESERRLRLALRLVEAMQPSILLIDEITEMLPTRSDHLDGGVSKNMLGQLLNFSAQETLRGRVLLIATSNLPERVDPAILDRFLVIPFLPPIPSEIVQLFGIMEKRITGRQTLPLNSREVAEAAELLYRKNTSPRKVYEIVNHALLFSSAPTLRPEDLVEACRQFTGAENPYAVAYSSLMAINLTSFKTYLPWARCGDLSRFPFPWYLQEIIKENGEPDRQALNKRLQEYRQLAKW